MAKIGVQRRWGAEALVEFKGTAAIPEPISAP